MGAWGSKRKTVSAVAVPTVTAPPQEQAVVNLVQALSLSSETCPRATIVEIAINALNNWLAQMAKRPLPNVGSCTLGTLSDLHLCSLASFPIALTYGGQECTLIVELTEIFGLDQMRVVEFDYQITPDGELTVHLEMVLGALSGRINTQLQNCGLIVQSLLGGAVRCSNSIIRFGSAEQPVSAGIVLEMPIGCTEAVQVQVPELIIDLGPIEIDCRVFRLPQILGLSAVAGQQISTWTTEFVKSYVQTQLQAAVQNLVHLAVSPLRAPLPPTVSSAPLASSFDGWVDGRSAGKRAPRWPPRYARMSARSQLRLPRTPERSDHSRAS